MKKIFTIFPILFLLCTAQSKAQCTSSFSGGLEIYVHDTTYEWFYADTSLGTADYTYSWSFSDGQTGTGPAIKHAFTQLNSSVDLTLTTTNTSLGCTVTTTETIANTFVFSCSHFVPPSFLANISSLPNTRLVQSNLNDGSTVSVELGSGPDYPTYPVFLGLHVDVNWGNGRSTTQEMSTEFGSGSSSFLGSDSASSPNYRYSGEYIVTGSAHYYYGALTCPATVIEQLTVKVGGEVAQPVIVGDSSYCVGDTLWLSAIDTTQFHNLLHTVDTTGSLMRYTFPMEWYTAQYNFPETGPRSLNTFSWYDRNHTLISSDSILVINSVTMADTGTYYFVISNKLTGVDLETPVHVRIYNGVNAGSISGSTSVCEGSTTTLTETVSGGTWTSANPMIATISATGVINTVAPGTASINYTVSNSCGTTAAAYNVTVDPAAVCNPTGVANTAISSVISIYPNPANGSFTVEVPQADNNAVITITDMSGKVMSVVTPNTKNVKIPVVLNLASGTYLIKVDAAGKVYRDKLVIW